MKRLKFGLDAIGYQGTVNCRVGVINYARYDNEIKIQVLNDHTGYFLFGLEQIQIALGTDEFSAHKGFNCFLL